MKKNSIKLRIANNAKGEQVLKAIFSHPMETGLRLDKKTREKIPADYIKDLRVSVDGESYFEIMWSESVSKNPYLTFVFAKPVIDGQQMNIYWVDNNQKETSYDFVVRMEQGRSFRFSGDKDGSEIISLLPEAGPVCKTRPPVPAN